MSGWMSWPCDKCGEEACEVRGVIPTSAICSDCVEVMGILRDEDNRRFKEVRDKLRTHGGRGSRII